jgi:hypothetical protein
MAGYEDLYQALRNADAAGDTEAAQKLSGYIQSLPAKTTAEPVSDNPVSGNSFLENLGAGVKKGGADLALGVKQRFDDAAATLESKFGGQSVNAALGLPNAADVQKQTQAQVDQKRIEDTPLMETAGGKVGNFVGKAVPAIAAAFIPGGQTLTSSIITGGALGAAEPTATGESVMSNVVGGAAGGAGGYGLAKGIGMLAGKVADKAAAQATLNAPRDTIAAVARDAGYTIPPSQTNPGLINSMLEGFSGKLLTAQKASVSNQAITNRLVAEEVGLNPAQAITKDALSNLRRTAGQAYDAVASSGQVTPTAAYTKALDDIVAPYVQATKGFPNAKPNPVIGEIDALRSSSFDAGSAVAKIKTLRGDADTAYRTGNKDLGKALKSGANAIEDAIDTHLTATGAPAGLLSKFRDARQAIAKSYSIEKSLNDATGNVNAGKLAQQLDRGRSLSGNLQTIAQVAQAFPKAAQEVKSSMTGVSPIDYLASGLLHNAGSGALSLMSLGARPIARAAILSKPYQRIMGATSYEGSAILNTLASEPARIGFQAGGIDQGKTKLPRIAQ